MAQTNGAAVALATRKQPSIPMFGVVYGASKLGKTTAALYDFPTAIFVAQPGALKPALGVVGNVPKSVDLENIQAVGTLLREIAALPAARRPSAVVVDDFSLLAERTVTQLEKRYASAKNGYEVWSAVRTVVLEFREIARHCGVHVLLTAHESAPTMKNGAFVRGGPRLPGRLPEDLCAACDAVFRVDVDELRIGPWPAVVRCSPLDRNYISGDRHGIAYDKAPLNLAELLRAAGYWLPRAPGLEWAEEVVEALAVALAGATERTAVLREAVEPLRRHPASDLAIRWIFRDALDRAAIRARLASPLASFGC